MMDETNGRSYAPGVDLGGLMQVLSEHLYSTPTVAIRELVQNAHDSTVRRRIATGEIRDDSAILVRTDHDAGTLTIVDRGAGLTRHEIVSYLATIGAGQTRVVRAETSSDDLIGQFGLGFLSAFSVADLVTVETTPVSDPLQRWQYRSTNGITFELTDVSGAHNPPHQHEIGSTVTLLLKSARRTLLDEQNLFDTLQHYCGLLAEPLYVEIAGELTRVNAPPPWRNRELDHVEPEERRAAIMAFAQRFEPSFEPICTIEVAPFANSDAVGVLWVQGGSSYGSSDNRRMQVFLRGMLLDDDSRELLPRWAGFVGGVVESLQLVPTASREDIQRTASYDAIQGALSEALIIGLASIARSAPSTWRRIVARHNESLLGAALVDDRLFDVIADEVSIPTSKGDRRVADLVLDGSVYIGTNTGDGFEEMLFRSLQVPVARGERYAVTPFVRKWADKRGVTVVEIGTEAGNRAMFREVDLPASDQMFLRSALADKDEELVPARFAPAELALVSVTDREAELKQRLDDDDADRRISAMALRLARLHTDQIGARPARRLYVNIDCPAVTALIAANALGNEETTTAAALLHATKAVLAGGRGNSLVDALAVINRHVERLLGY